MTCRPMLLPEAMSVSVVLWQPGSMLMSKSHVITKGHVMSLVWVAAWDYFDKQGLCKLVHLSLL